MKTFRNIGKSVSNLMQGGKPTIYHFRIAKNLTQKGAEKSLQKLRSMREEKKIHAFAISLNCTGGSLSQSKLLYDAFQQTAYDLKAPIYTFAEDFALESAFYLLSIGNKIFANPYALLGDVSYTVRMVRLHKLLKRYEIDSFSVESGKHKKRMSILEESTPEEKEWLDNIVKITYEEITAKIVKSRGLIFERKGLTPEKVKKDILDGKTFTATEALNTGLIDGITTFEEFKETHYKDYKLVEYTADRDSEVTLRSIGESCTDWYNALSSSNAQNPPHSGKILNLQNAGEIDEQLAMAEKIVATVQSPMFQLRLKELLGEELANEYLQDIRNRMMNTSFNLEV